LNLAYSQFEELETFARFGTNQSYNRLGQSNIDEELFDIVAGFEALKKKSWKNKSTKYEP
jgi:hypothetical protein